MVTVNYITSCKRRNRLYFSSKNGNHLGNVLAIIADAWYIDTCIEEVGIRYAAHITQATDYSAFGAPLPGRSWYSSKDYRLGFNGKENTNEVSQDGDYLDFGARVYDSRLGRWLSLDPRERDYPWQTPYAYFKNSPISTIDFLGKGEAIENSAKEASETSAKEAGEASSSAPQSTNKSSANWTPTQLGTFAHRTFTEYIRTQKSPLEWKSNMQVMKGVDRSRPDVWYTSMDGKVGGVWELKPNEPSPSSLLAQEEAKTYSDALNYANNTNIYAPGSQNGAPKPFNEPVLTLPDMRTGLIFQYTNPLPNTGALYWDQVDKDGHKIPMPVVVPETKPKIIPQVPWRLIPPERTPGAWPIIPIIPFFWVAPEAVPALIAI